MGLYSRFVLPRLIDLAMKDEAATARRAAVVPKAAGSVLEVGIGSGHNLPFYSAAVTRLQGVDPSAPLLSMARKKLNRMTFPVELVCESAAQLRIDTVVTTWTLCSVPDPSPVLREMRRVLKPQGRLLFIEHGFSPDTEVLAWQRRLNPIWRRVGGGCNLDRRIDELIRSVGFRIAELQASYLPGPRPMTYTYEGFAC